MDEAEYKVGRQVKHGVDWIVGDGTANLFVECKTKRLRHDAKITVEGEVLEAQLNILAEAIVQLYKNIRDAVDGKTNWTPNQLPIYPLVVTLEEWYLFSPLTTAYVHRQVKTLLERSCIDPRVADDMPYTVASIDEIELVGQIFDRTGLGTFFARKTEPAHSHTMLAGFAWTCFEEHMRDIKRILFSADWERFLPDTAEGWIRNLRGPTASLV
ncbi:hypothetical protein [Paraburkholderia elongata]|uniref:Restriction endonuclease n=1 Tax=Paraburkholderia elongata TaxID=2675747 RepID=A0A972NZ67_9BURK|nr:hypothetical protein [Paraburkholderia elongata]NPT61163.1 hypothetical protein [Paraburkholderia elongata]